MSITGKIKLGFAALLAFLATQFAVQQLLERATQTNINIAITKNFAAADALAEITSIAQQLRRYEKEFFIYVDDPNGRSKYRKEWTDAYGKLSDNLAKMSANADGAFNSNDISAFASWMQATQFYGDEFRAIMDKADAGSIVPADAGRETTTESAKKDTTYTASVATNFLQATRLANQMIGPGKDRFKEVLEGAQKLRKEKTEKSAQSVIEIQAHFNYAAMITLGIFLAGLALSVYLIISVPRTVRRTINEFVGITDKMSKGDLKQVIEADGVVEFVDLAKALERLRIAQSGLLERLRAKSSTPPKA